MNNDELKVSKDIYAQFRNPSSNLFLETNTEKIFQAAKTDANLYPVSRDEILAFKNNLELASRNFEQRTLGNRRPRYLNYRSYISFSPRSIICGDLLFVKSLKHLGKKTVVISLFMDIFRFIHYFIPSFIHSFIQLILYSFFHSFIHQLIHSLHLSLKFAYSRMVYLSTQKSTSSRETFQHFEEALKFFGCSKHDKFKYFASDRGYFSPTSATLSHAHAITHAVTRSKTHTYTIYPHLQHSFFTPT